MFTGTILNVRSLIEFRDVGVDCTWTVSIRVLTWNYVIWIGIKRKSGSTNEGFFTFTTFDFSTHELVALLYFARIPLWSPRGRKSRGDRCMHLQPRVSGNNEDSYDKILFFPFEIHSIDSCTDEYWHRRETNRISRLSGTRAFAMSPRVLLTARVERTLTVE